MGADRLTEADFDRTSWHDDTVYAFAIRLGDIAAGDWRSELVFDIDHIVEWVCRPGGGAAFLVVPATLTFHDVTDLAVALDYGDSSHRVALGEPQVDRLARTAVEVPQVRLGRPYWRWTIAFNHPRGGAISFGASGFTQTARAEPVLADEQRLPPAREGRGWTP
jgi:hypothetical protein